MNSNKEILADLKERLKAIPQLPGVYLFKNANQDVIYVGKARLLRNRLRSYFQDLDKLDPKVRAMMLKVKDLDYIITSGEVEALILECNLIKSYQPRYNIFFRDDKSYPYLKITLSEEYPRLVITREKSRDDSRYFGPYADVSALKETVRLLTDIFPVRACKNFRPGRRPCLNRDIGRCLGPCTGEVEPRAYREMVTRIMAFLEGEVQDLAVQLEREMHEAAEGLDFERAADLRDKLTAVRRVSEQQKVASASPLNADLIATAGSGRARLALVFRLRGGKLVGKDTFWLHVSLEQEDVEVLAFFIQQYYADNPDLPAEILVGTTPLDREILEAWLRRRSESDRSAKKGENGGNLPQASCHSPRTVIRVPVRGEKKKLLDMARENAVLLWEERLRQGNSNREILADLARLLGLEVVPERIECFDISHWSGQERVGSMVVFTDGEKEARAYRRFVLAAGNNDYQALAEVLRRRLQAGIKGENSFLPLPDLILVDGGLGQANTAAGVVAEKGLDIPVIGLAEKNEEIFMPGISQPLRLPRSSEVLKFLQRIRDEAHRFALDHNRKRLGKRGLVSVLDHIEGIGERRRQELMKRYGSLEKIKEATPEELAKVPAMNRKAAQAVYDFLHRQ